jgi:hypothetical protein
MLWRRILKSSGPAAPVWVTTSPLAEAEWEEPYLQTLLATSANPPVGYGVFSGALPPGLSLVGDTITGTPSPSPDAPAWVTAAGSLGGGTQGAAFSVDLDATGAAAFSIKSGLLPWGLILDTATGTLAGDLSIIGGAEDSPGPAPTWTTAAGSLGALNESAVASLSIAATGAASYAIEAGGLPWGLLLNRDTGAITGTTAEVGGGATPEPPNTITWSAPASTNLGSFAVGASVSIAQTIGPVTGVFMVSSGVMPWGLSVARNGGLISGTVGATNAAGAYSFTVFALNPGDGSFGYRTYTITIT